MRRFVLTDAHQVRAMWAHVDGHWKGIDPPLEVRIAPYKSTRSLEQNARLWAMLDDVARQVEWHGARLSAEDWKHMFTASLSQQRVVPNLDGTGFVVMGTHTSSMSIAKMSELMDLIEAFGTERSVVFSNPKEPA